MSFHISIRASGYTSTPAASVGFNAAVKKDSQPVAGQDLGATADIIEAAAALRDVPLERPLN